MSKLAAAVAFMFGLLVAGTGHAQAANGQLTEEEVGQSSWALIFGNRDEREQALRVLRERGDLDTAAALILAIRFRRSARADLSNTLQEITGHDANDWFGWMLWQETHPEVRPHPSFETVKLGVFDRIDPNFRTFFQEEWIRRERMHIRLEEVTWGGVAALTGIPSLDNPRMIDAASADYMLDTDLIFGVEINGDARAYPLRIMGWHEMFNDVIGGVPVALAYCTLCGSGILYETTLEDQDEPLVFGSSGLLYRSNKLMFDWQTRSLWNQFTGRPVVGPLVKSGIELRTRPVVITDWQSWRARHPDTKILSIDTGHTRDYRSGVVYADYFGSDALMFPAFVRDGDLPSQKDYVFGIRDVGSAKAWPLTAFEGGAVINDSVGARNVLLLGDEATRTVRAYDRGEIELSRTDGLDTVSGPGGDWRVQEDAIVGPDGKRLPRIAGSISYWFAWDGYLGARSELYDPATAQ